MINIGEKIQKLLIESGKKAPDLAKHLGITKQSTYYLLNKPNIDTGQLEKIAEFFHVKITYFFNEVDTSDFSVIIDFMRLCKFNDELTSSRLLLKPFLYQSLVDEVNKSNKLRDLIENLPGKEHSLDGVSPDLDYYEIVFSLITKLPAKRKELFKDVLHEIHFAFQNKVRNNRAIIILLTEKIITDVMLNTLISETLFEVEFPIAKK